METNDLVTKNFETYPDIAADILNALLYEGKQEIKEENLLASPTETLYQGETKLRNQLEDIAKYDMADGEIRTVYLFANQTKKDPDMLLRKASYVGGIYREQYEKKTQNRFPVIELVLYWGKGKWTGGRSTHELFEGKKLPARTMSYVDDLKLHVFELRNLPEEVRQRFQSDMHIVVDYLAEGKDYRSEQKVVHKEALIKLLRVLSGDENVEDTETILQEMQVKEEDEISMCELFDQYVRKGRKEGLREGRIEGRAEGKREGRVEGRAEVIPAMIRTCKRFHISYQDTADSIRKELKLPDIEIEENMKLYW